MQGNEDWQQNVPHRRFNLLTGKWILCSPHRAKRPWLGQVEKVTVGNQMEYDPACYLCPGNKRSATENSTESPMNPQYKGTFTFTNDFSALLPPIDQEVQPEDELLVSEKASGLCKVICFSPKHHITLPEMEQKDIIEVVDTWTREYKEIGSNPDIGYVQIFENKGAVMGCSNPHPHCQIWASSFVPEEPQTELNCMKDYHKKKHSCMLCDYTKLELTKKIRIVCENDEFVVVVPYWALWPYEVLLLSKSHLSNLAQFTPVQKEQYADILKRITTKFDNLFQTSFPYSSGIHQSPSGSQGGNDVDAYCHFHMHFYPPLLRSSTVKKFMVGYEMLGEAQRDITAEQSAQRLRDLSEIHYKKTVQ